MTAEEAEVGGVTGNGWPPPASTLNIFPRQKPTDGESWTIVLVILWNHHKSIVSTTAMGYRSMVAGEGGRGGISRGGGGVTENGWHASC